MVPMVMPEKLMDDKFAHWKNAFSPMESSRSFTKRTDFKVVEPSHSCAGMPAT